MSASQKNTFYGGAAILAVSAAIVKVIGAIYRVPLGNILSDEVMADYNSAYNIYSLLLTISTAGLPVALSKTISEAHTLHRYNQARKVFQVAFAAFLTLGLLSFLGMTVLAAPVSKFLLSNPKAVYCVLALSPSVLCVCIIASFRGYFQGRFNMWPTGVSQIIEAAFKLFVGLALALYLVSVAGMPEHGSVGAIIGVSTGSVVALVFIVLFYLHSRREEMTLPAHDTPDSAKTILTTLLSLAIPITLGSATTSLVTLVDGKLVMSQLTSIFQTVDGLELAADGTGPALDAARGLYGIYSKTLSIYNLPFALIAPLTACIIPAVSASLAKRDRLGAQQVSESAFRMGMLLTLPMGMGLFALGGPIMGLLFPAVDTSIAGPLLSILGLASIFVSIQLLCNSILQANGLVNLPILAIILGGGVKIAVNYILVGNPDVRINGAPVGTLCCFAVSALLEMFMIHRAVPAPPRFLRAISKPLMASAVMAAAVWAVHGLLDRLFRGLDFFWKVNAATGTRYFSYLGQAGSTVVAILVGVAVYLALVLALRTISREDLSLMPKGEKIAKLLHIR